MLCWAPGPRPEDGAWAPHWYDSLWRSTGFAPPEDGPPPDLPPALADTQVAPPTRDPEEEALLSSAPTPFGTTSYDLATVPGDKKPRHAWSWALLGLLALVVVSVVVSRILT